MATVSISKRRDKLVLSCSDCRSRKLRCDRQSPCGSCVRRGNAAACTFSTSEQERRNAIDYRPHARSQPAHQRIARLESLIVDMMDRENLQRPADQVTDAAAPADEMGKLSLTDDQTLYTGSSHWTTMLEDIRHLKDELSDDSPSEDTYTDHTVSDTGSVPCPRISLLSSGQSLPKEQILAMVPARKIVDRHVSHFFNVFDMGPYFLHRQQFLAEYASFWDKPQAASITWLGLLFSMMSISTLLQQQDAGPDTSSETLDTYRTLTIHCLVAGDYIHPRKHTLLTLTLLFALDQAVDPDASTANWVLIGVIVRIAQRAGLHRDPSHWPNIRPLQAELRRRLWMALYQMDFFASTQLGLPRAIKDSQCDTRPPLHLLPSDLGPEHDTLPVERPLTEATPLLFVAQRYGIVRAAAEIYDATEAGTPSPARMAALRDTLDKAIAAIPVGLRHRPLETAVASDPVSTLHQIFIDILIHKAVYLLHRRSFVKGVGVQEKESNEQCIKAALAILEHQKQLAEETQPGGLMYAIRWKATRSVNQEFLQATTMLCFALSRFHDEHGRETGAGVAVVARPWRDEVVEALGVAKGLWEQTADRSAEAKKAVRVIAAVLQRQSGNLPRTAIPAFGTSDPISQISDGASQEYFDSFGIYGQEMALDPSLFVADISDIDMASFGGALDGFGTEQGAI